MISPAVIAAALAFWAPYSPPAGACPGGVVVHENATNPVVFAGVDSNLIVQAWALQGTGDCELWTTKWFNHQSAARKCTFIAHEIGHSRFGLPHAPAGIMKASDPPVPGVCYSANGRKEVA